MSIASYSVVQAENCSLKMSIKISTVQRMALFFCKELICSQNLASADAHVNVNNGVCLYGETPFSIV